MLRHAIAKLEDRIWLCEAETDGSRAAPNGNTQWPVAHVLGEPLVIRYIATSICYIIELVYIDDLYLLWRYDLYWYFGHLWILYLWKSYIQSINIGHTSKVNINMGYIYLINIWYTYKFIDFTMKIMVIFRHCGTAVLSEGILHCRCSRWCWGAWHVWFFWEKALLS